MIHKKWQFWIDRGGTFTDIVGYSPKGELITHKVLSENPEQYKDAAVQGIRDILGLAKNEAVTPDMVEAIKMGTTVGTNALLERKGERIALVTTKGFKDQLRIAYQNRPKIFDRNIILPEQLYEKTVEVKERILASGKVIEKIDVDGLKKDLQKIYDDGIRSLAIVFLHGFRFPDHENIAAQVAKELGFTQISISHKVSPLVKMVGRGDTTVVDAYLSPVLKRYVSMVVDELGHKDEGLKESIRLMFMQSNGGLTDANLFEGKDCILSGPAGGIVGAVKTAQIAEFDKIVTFDMGGTSTDVAHFAGTYERSFETQVAGVRVRAPMMNIHTVAAGGGSICYFDGGRYRVGPGSAGANPGPACYRRGGPLAVTDCNVMLGKIQPDLFPAVFGKNADEQLDKAAVIKRFEEVELKIKDGRTHEQIAESFIHIAVLNMARAIKQISVQRGYNVTDYTLVTFGGAGGQHACLVAESLGIRRVQIHPFAGVLSAFGMGLADNRSLKEKTIEKILSEEVFAEITKDYDQLKSITQKDIYAQGFEDKDISFEKKIYLKYQGSDKPLEIMFNDLKSLQQAFDTAHKTLYGFLIPEKKLVVDMITVEAIGTNAEVAQPKLDHDNTSLEKSKKGTRSVFMKGEYRETGLYNRDEIPVGSVVKGPAIIIEKTATTVIEPGWNATMSKNLDLILEHQENVVKQHLLNKADLQRADPVMLEVFNNLFMSIAEQMGLVLENTAYSVNIKERLDFSCALFDKDGGLIANAPHMPVHLGSMGASVRAVVSKRMGNMKPGDVYILNDPYDGGTHLPDITVISPVFDKTGKEILFYVASRGHHADVGGKSPGSMPPDSYNIEEEGVLINNFQIVKEGVFLEQETRDLLHSTKYPARNAEQNIADLKAQIASNNKGIQEILKMIGEFGLDVVQAYTKHVQANAEEQVRRVIDVLKDGAFTVHLDNGSQISVKISIDKKAREATVDFTGTSPQLSNNFNAPSAVCRAAVLYVFRTLVDDEIPMNEGCLKPVNIIIPKGSMLAPAYPAPVVAGNVETSQCVTDCLYGALGVMASAQGTMNNFTFGNDTYQYYETISGGSGAGPDFNGTSAVQTHMTNSRLTDPEVLEMRFPVKIEQFSLRPNSGGQGKFNGGDGSIRQITFLEKMTASLLSNHHDIPPFGLEGGENGALGEAYVIRANGKTEKLNSTDQAEMEVGDSFLIKTPGGGGFGKKK